jgi:hypothetical protein
MTFYYQFRSFKTASYLGNAKALKDSIQGLILGAVAGLSGFMQRILCNLLYQKFKPEVRYLPYCPLSS